MLLSDFSDPSQLYYVPRERLSAFRSNKPVDMRTICRPVKAGSISETDRDLLEELRKAYGKQLGRFHRLFNMRDYRRYVIGDSYRDLRDLIVKDREGVERHLGELAVKVPHGGFRHMVEPKAVIEPLLTGGLQGRHWKCALQQSAGIKERWWRQIQVRAMSEIRARRCFEKFNEAERRYCYQLLSGLSPRFFDMLDGHVPPPVVQSDAAAIKHRHSLCVVMKSTIHSVMGRPPRHRENRSIWFDESSYSVTYFEKDDETRFELMSCQPGQRVFVKVKGRFPCREFIVPAGTGARIPVAHVKKPTIQLVWTDAGLEVHVSIALKKHKPVLDKSRRSLTRYPIQSFGGRLPAKSAFLSEWFDAGHYESVYDASADETIVSLMKKPGATPFCVTVKGRLPMKDKIKRKSGDLEDLKSKYKPVLHFKRGKLGSAMIGIVGNPAAPHWAKPAKGTEFVKFWSCPVKTLTGVCAPVPKTMSGRWFEGSAYTAVRDESGREMTITVSRPKLGHKFSVVVGDNVPIRDLILQADGQTVPCRNRKKPAFRLTYPKKGPVMLEVLLPGSNPVGQVASNDGLLVLVSHNAQDILDRKPVSRWFEPHEYTACHDERTDMTNIVMNGVHDTALTLTVKGCPRIASQRIDREGRSALIANPLKAAVRLEILGCDPFTGLRFAGLRMKVSNRRKTEECPYDSAAWPDRVRAMAFDLGYTEVAYDALGNRFGEKLGVVLSASSDWLTQKVRIRNRFQAKTRPLPPLPDGTVRPFDAAKAKRILKNNLGSKKFDKRMNAFRSELKRLINESLNRMMDMHEGAVLIFEAFGHTFNFQGLSKVWRRRLSSWVRGEMDERIEFKASERGVRVLYVPAAYSSQTCPECGYTSRKNRKGDRFKCRACGLEAHADIKAAEALLLRAHDSHFTRWTSAATIKEHHMSEYQAYCAKKGIPEIEEK